jgi:hypothetical protein
LKRRKFLYFKGTFENLHIRLAKYWNGMAFHIKPSRFSLSDCHCQVSYIYEPISRTW